MESNINVTAGPKRSTDRPSAEKESYTQLVKTLNAAWFVSAVSEALNLGREKTRLH